MNRETRKRFERQNLTEIAKGDKYFEDSVRRYKKDCIREIDDLIMFARKLSNEQQQEIFTYDIVKRLVSQILHGNSEGLHFYSKATDKTKEKSVFRGENDKYEAEFNDRILKISAFLAQAGIEVCIRHYELTLGKTLDPRLHKYIVEPLLNAMAICNTIINPHTMVTKEQTIKYKLHKKK